VQCRPRRRFSRPLPNSGFLAWLNNPFHRANYWRFWLPRHLFPIYSAEHFPVSERITHITDDTFEAEVLQAKQPVLVDYWAEWCGPCRMIGPILDEIAVEYAGRVKVCKLNVDENQNTPPKYGIRGIPTLMLFRDGKVDATKVGAGSKSQLVAFLDGSLA
jgi:thioredoxin 1